MSHYVDYSLPHKERYDKWALHYNENVAARQYQGLQYIIDFMLELSIKKQLNCPPHVGGFKILDVGCGTGLVGEVLAQKGFTHIDGIDLSHKMVEVAQETGAYQHLIGWCDINKGMPFFLHNQYDLTISSGVFTLDMVTPQCLSYLVQTTKVGGAIVIGTRTEWYDTYDFKAFYEQLIQKGYIELVDCRMDAPYLVGEFEAHYWAFLVKNNQIN